MKAIVAQWFTRKPRNWEFGIRIPCVYLWVMYDLWWLNIKRTLGCCIRTHKTVCKYSLPIYIWPMWFMQHKPFPFWENTPAQAWAVQKVGTPRFWLLTPLILLVVLVSWGWFSWKNRLMINMLLKNKSVHSTPLWGPLFVINTAVRRPS